MFLIRGSDHPNRGTDGRVGGAEAAWLSDSRCGCVDGHHAGPFGIVALRAGAEASRVSEKPAHGALVRESDPELTNEQTRFARQTVWCRLGGGLS